MTTDQSALIAAACEYDDANAYQSIPARDAAYKGFLAGAQWQAAQTDWTLMADRPPPAESGFYLVTKAHPGKRSRTCAPAYWTGSRFFNAANVVAWRPLPEVWAGGES